MNLKRFETDPDSGFFWKQRGRFNIDDDAAVSKDSRIKLVQSLIRNLQKRCFDMHSVFDEAASILDTTQWKRQAFFVDVEGEHNTSTAVFDDSVELLISNDDISVQLEHQGVDTAAILSEWTNLKNKMRNWNEKTKKFPPESWKQIGEHVKVENYSNLFTLIDYLLCHSLSSADAERGFSALKQVKSSKRAKVSNALLTVQLRTKIDGPEIAGFKPEKSINSWLLNPTNQSKSGNMRAKRVDYGDKERNKPGPKPKKTKQTPIFGSKSD